MKIHEIDFYGEPYIATGDEDVENIPHHCPGIFNAMKYAFTHGEIMVSKRLCIKNTDVLNAYPEIFVITPMAWREQAQGEILVFAQRGLYQDGSYRIDLRVDTGNNVSVEFVKQASETTE